MVFHTNCLYNRFSHELSVCDGFFIHVVSFKVIFCMKKGYGYVWGKCKNAWVLRVCFFEIEKYTSEKCSKSAPEPSITTTCFVRTWGLFSEFREKYLVFREGTRWKRYLGDWLLIILNKQQSFLYQRLCWRDSKPNSW